MVGTFLQMNEMADELEKLYIPLREGTALQVQIEGRKPWFYELEKHRTMDMIGLTNGISEDNAGSIAIRAKDKWDGTKSYSLTQIIGCIFSGSIGDDGGAIKLSGSESGAWF